MTITITIDDSAAKDLLQNIALAKGMNDVTDEEARIRLGQDIGKDIASLARQGHEIRKRIEERAEIETLLAKVTVS